MEATNGAVVALSYTLSLDDGGILGEPEDDLEYLHGYSNIIPGLERALEGTQLGERRSVVVEPADAYGEHHADRLITAPTNTLPDHIKLEPGATVMVDTGRGPVQLTVTEVNDDTVVFDANHPLAGKRLHFDVEVVGVRAAERHELLQGYPGPQRTTFS